MLVTATLQFCRIMQRFLSTFNIYIQLSTFSTRHSQFAYNSAGRVNGYSTRARVSERSSQQKRSRGLCRGGEKQEESRAEDERMGSGIIAVDVAFANCCRRPNK